MPLVRVFLLAEAVDRAPPGFGVMQYLIAAQQSGCAAAGTQDGVPAPATLAKQCFSGWGTAMSHLPVGGAVRKPVPPA